MSRAPLPADLTLAQRGILAASSVLGLGYLPLAPGTWGSLGGLVAWWAMGELPTPTFAAVTALAVALAVVISARAERLYGGHDVQHIVIDELVGILVTAIGVPFALPQILAAFVVFRLLDTLKPPPIGYIDRCVGGGLGVVMDDVAAGLVGCAGLHLARHMLGGWW